MNDLMGKVFDRWTVVGYAGKTGHNQMWRCRCECGGEKTIPACNLVRGLSKSCGCLRKEVCGDTFRTHGMADKHPLYRLWADMRRRCLNPKDAAYHLYGGRGISICEAWDDFEIFVRDMGPRPGKEYTLERTDYDKGYSPENCVWGDWYTQNSNKAIVENSETGVVGVRKVGNRFKAYIKVDGKQKHLGSTGTLEEAKILRETALAQIRAQR